MKIVPRWLAGALALWSLTVSSQAEVKVLIDHNGSDTAAAEFKFKNVPAPVRSNAAQNATFTLVDGHRDGNGGDLGKLHDGLGATGGDEPGENFFFSGDGGRVLVDLGSVIDVKQIDTYSWHSGSRAPQVYKVYGSDGSTPGFNPQTKRPADPAQAGWRLIASVDTRPKEGEAGGQYGVSVADPAAIVGRYRYLLFDVARTEDKDPFGNTFYSEINVIDRNAPAVAPETPAQSGLLTVQADGGKYQISLNTSETPELTEWAQKKLLPVVQTWYPLIVKMLPSPGYEAPKKFSIMFAKDMKGVAFTAGTHIQGAGDWYKHNYNGEGIGSIVHELVHVVQQYGHARRTNANPTKSPGWLVEGIPDYIRWYKYEPQSHGADFHGHDLSRMRYDGSYRVTANFLNWVTEKYDKDIVPKLNVAMREGVYQEDIWKKLTGHSVEELGDEWRAALAVKAGLPVPAPTVPGAVSAAGASPAAASAGDASINTLTPAEKAAGWTLLFDGKDFTGWHNFKGAGVRPGWQIKDGALTCVDPHQAGDIVTADKYGWFELQLDYNISEGGNSGIMYRVTDAGGAVWATGPEFQLEDNVKAADPVRCGWLYALYQPPVDPTTGKTLDATKPVGQWNHVRLLISPEKCEHDINGVKYFDYVLGSGDFNARVAKSKFAQMPGFAKAASGYLALQGDHGSVAFRNIKVRRIEPNP